jgi:uncharacterized protein YecT (DUF1311 family)
MKRMVMFVLRALTLSLMLWPIALASTDAEAQTQSEINEEACRSYEKSDAALNKVYQQILKDYKAEALFIEKLKHAQRAWVAYRDAHLQAIYPGPPQEYGSINPMCRCQILAELTKKRTEELQQWLRGVPEGEVCSGSIRLQSDAPHKNHGHVQRPRRLSQVP